METWIFGAGRADYINGNEIYEIKPATQYADQYGKNQLQNYVDHSRIKGAQKGTSLLPSIPTDIKIKDLKLIETKDFIVYCDVSCITSLDPTQAGMIYYVPHNWRVENKTKKTTQEMISSIVFRLSIAAGLAEAGRSALSFGKAAASAADAAAATIILVPTPLLEMERRKLQQLNPNTVGNDSI